MSILFFIVLPVILGLLWKDTLEGGGFVYAYLSGFFTIWAIFELLGVPMVFMYVPVHVQVWVFSVVFWGLSALILYIKRKALSDYKQLFCSTQERVKRYFYSFDAFQWIYFFILVGVLSLQVYYAIFYDVGNLRSDDGTYVVISSSAIYDDVFYRTDTVSGIFRGYTPLMVKYGLCGIYVFYAYASVITSLGVAIIEHTICEVLFLAMAYGSIYLLCGFAFPSTKERDNRMAFMIFVALIFIFGYHSTYSLTFRLLGPIWQGKAILATVVTPFLLAVVPQFLEKGATNKKLIISAAISLSAISFTLGGVIVMGVIPGLICLTFIIRTKRIKDVIYLPAMWLFPVMNMVIYLTQK